MRAFVFDTETTGLPVREGALADQPYIVQFAGILGDISVQEGFVEVSRIDIYIKPPISIPFAASQVHGIYDDRVAHCFDFGHHAPEILRILNTSDMVVGHNIEFDEQILRYELERHNRQGEYQPLKSICTMKSTIDFCKLQGRGFGYKAPRLNELYKHLFGTWFDGAHNAIKDVEATAQAFGELVKQSVIPLEENSLLRLF